jgi:hypothetical protein
MITLSFSKASFALDSSHIQNQEALSNAGITGDHVVCC